MRIINLLRVKVKGEGKNCELAECAMRRGVSVDSIVYLCVSSKFPIFVVINKTM